MSGATQSVSAVHVVRQAALVLHWNGSHSDGVTVLHVPMPSQVRPGVNVDMRQVAPAQAVPFAYRWQFPAPSQVPSVPQLAIP